MSNSDHSHSRYNALTGEWVLVSPHRLQRPWQGQLESIEAEALPVHDAECYLCPGNERANGNINPDYSGAFAFDNDFAALTTESNVDFGANPLFGTRPESGCCRVVCYTERHDLRLSTMGDTERVTALTAMIDEFAMLDARDDINYVQIFENRGQMMGCSNPHPHAQVWATSGLPQEPASELKTQVQYFEANNSVLLDDYLRAELEDGQRIVVENKHSVGLVPFWAVWPYETLLLPRRVVAAPTDMSDEEVADLAQTLGRVLAAYDTLFGTAAPYSLGLHPRPSDGAQHPAWQFHIHIYPPLLRSATIRKHLVGFEMLGMPQRDLTPEVAAEKLRQSINR
ncbi:MAG: UDP-glucose--hexose-1-phosphate uridylyltransferase [Woeseiaceae bacterium]